MRSCVPDKVLISKNQKHYLDHSVAGIIICSFATGPLDPVALRLKYALKSVFDVIFTEKNNDDKNIIEVFCLHFELYCA